MRALSFLIVLAISVPAKAQWITFEQTYGGSLHDEAKSVATAPDCGYAVVGYTSSFGTGFYDFYLVRTDSLGDTLWTRTYGGVDREVAFWVEPTTNGGFVMAGYTESYGAGGNDFYLVKVDSNGDTVWTRTYGGSGTETARCVKQTNDGGYVVAGFSNSFGAGHFDFYLVRTDSNGIALWDTTYGGGEWDGRPRSTRDRKTSGLSGRTRWAALHGRGHSVGLFQKFVVAYIRPLTVASCCRDT
jgi:hypothetical protein